MHGYDHRVHAGNAGDVWKHFLLSEVADYLLVPGCQLAYAESHAGRPEYALNRPGEWEHGIGLCWRMLHIIKYFCYFDILSDLNPEGLKIYPGSTRLIQEAAKRKGCLLRANIWDTDEGVGASWYGYSEIAFHHGDGFCGVGYLLDNSSPGLLLIDPPNIEPWEAKSAMKLQRKAEKKGWTVLWWQMTSKETINADWFEKYTLDFSKIGLSCGRWIGSDIILAGSDDDLREHLTIRTGEFVRAMNLDDKSQNRTKSLL